MTELTLWTRSFHPLANFGLGGFFFKGDNRGFSDKPFISARVWHYVKFSVDPPSIVDADVGSFPSQNAITGTTETYAKLSRKPTSTQTISGTPFTPTGMQHITVHINYQGQNLAIPGLTKDEDGEYKESEATSKRIVPFLRTYHDVSLVFNREAQTLALHSKVYGGGFPDCESFLLDSSGKPLFSGTHVRFGSASGQLWGDPKNAMTYAQLTIDLAGIGNFGAKLSCENSWDYHNGFSGVSHFESQLPTGSMLLSSFNDFHLRRDPSDSLSWLRDNTLGGRALFTTSESAMPQ